MAVSEKAVLAVSPGPALLEQVMICVVLTWLQARLQGLAVVGVSWEWMGFDVP